MSGRDQRSDLPLVMTGRFVNLYSSFNCMIKRVRVYKLEESAIYLNLQTERFEVGEGREFNSLREAKNFILKEKEQAFEGEFLIMDDWDGPNKFTAKKRIYDDYDKEYVIMGDRIDKYGNKKRETHKEANLFPPTEENLKLLEKGREMDREGWALIHKAKQIKLTN